MKVRFVLAPPRRFLSCFEPLYLAHLVTKVMDFIPGIFMDLCILYFTAAVCRVCCISEPIAFRPNRLSTQRFKASTAHLTNTVQIRL